MCELPTGEYENVGIHDTVLCGDSVTLNIDTLLTERILFVSMCVRCSVFSVQIIKCNYQSRNTLIALNVKILIVLLVYFTFARSDASAVIIQIVTIHMS